MGKQAGLVDEQGELPEAKRVLVIDSLSTAIGGLFGVSALTRLDDAVLFQAITAALSRRFQRTSSS